MDPHETPRTSQGTGESNKSRTAKTILWIHVCMVGLVGLAPQGCVNSPNLCRAAAPEPPGDSQAHIATEGPNPPKGDETPEATEARVMAELRSLGYTIQWVDSDRSTTFRHVIYMSKDLQGAEPWRRVKVLAHEGIHARQWRRERHFGRQYLADPTFRVEMEVQATREEVRLVRAWGLDESLAEYEALALAVQLDDMYDAAGYYDPNAVIDAVLGPPCHSG